MSLPILMLSIDINKEAMYKVVMLRVEVLSIMIAKTIK